MTSWRRSKAAVVAVASLAVFVDMLLYGVIIPIQPRLLAECGIPDDKAEHYMKYFSAAFSVGLLISTPTFGVISDRLRNRKVPMLCGLFALGASTVIFAYVRNFALLVTARLMQGVSAAATWVVGFAMVSDVYSSEDGLGFATSVIMSVHTVGNFMGPIVGGFLGGYESLSVPFLFCAGLAFLDFLARLLIDPPPPKVASRELQLGLRELLIDKDVLLSLCAILLLSSSYCAMEIYLVSWLQREWGFTVQKTALAMLAIITPSTVMGLLVGWLSDRMSRIHIIAVGLVLHGLAAPLIPLSWNIASLICFSVLFGLSVPPLSVPISPHLTNVIERRGDTSYARMYALQNMTYSLGMITGPWAVDFLKERWGFFVGMLVIPLFSLPMAPIFLFCSSSPKPLGQAVPALEEAPVGKVEDNPMHLTHTAY